MSDEDDKKAIIRFVIHHVLMMFMAVIMVFAVWYGYMSMQAQDVQDVEMPMSSNEKGAAHPLPDFIVDKINPDDLGELKP